MDFEFSPEQQDYIRAGSPFTSEEELAKLAKSSCYRVRRRTAENPKIGKETLRMLVNDDHPEVRISALEHAQADESMLDKLSIDPHLDVRFALAENPNLPIGILYKLAEDDNPYVSVRANQTLEAIQNIGNTGKVIIELIVDIVDGCRSQQRILI